MENTSIAVGTCIVCRVARGGTVPLCLIHWHALPPGLRQEWRLAEDPDERRMIEARILKYMRKVGAR